MQNIFEQASRQKLRFGSVRGELAVEQLWDLPLSSKTGFDLDLVAKTANAELKSVTEESFVEVRVSPARELKELKLAVVKHVIAVRIQENDAANQLAKRKAEKQKLVDLLDKKQDEALSGLTAEEIQKRIAELG